MKEETECLREAGKQSKKRGRCDREMTLKIWEKPGEVLPYKGLMGTCSQPGYVFGDFCLKQGIDFINFCLKQAAGYLFLDDKQPARMFYELNYLQQNFYLFIVLHRVWFRVKCPKQGINDRNSALNRVGNSAIFVFKNRVRV